MAKVSLDYFGERDIERVFIAKSLKVALRVEKLLTDRGMDYAVIIEKFMQRRIFFSSEYDGAALYVLADQAPFCRKLLMDNGFSNGVVEENS
jgi:hypothetical protein